MNRHEQSDYRCYRPAQLYFQSEKQGMNVWKQTISTSFTICKEVIFIRVHYVKELIDMQSSLKQECGYKITIVWFQHVTPIKIRNERIHGYKKSNNGWEK